MKIKSYCLKYNEDIENIPEDATHLIILYRFKPLPNIFFDKLFVNLTNLTLGFGFNYLVCNLPKKLKYLKFGSSFNQSVEELPNGLKNLIFGYSFNQPVDKLPESLTNLTFGYSFNQSVDKLPNSLKNLIFGYSFNQSVDKLPISLTYLIFGDSFNKPVNNLPNSLKRITFGYKFNQCIDNLPSSLKILKFGWEFNSRINNLPDKLINLELGCLFKEKINKFPKNLKKITVHSWKITIDNLPDSIETININGGEIKINYPKSLKNFTIDYPTDDMITNLPLNLKILTLRYTEKLTENINLPILIKSVYIDNLKFIKNIPFNTKIYNIQTSKLFE